MASGTYINSGRLDLFWTKTISWTVTFRKITQFWSAKQKKIKFFYFKLFSINFYCLTLCKYRIQEVASKLKNWKNQMQKSWNSNYLKVIFLLRLNSKRVELIGIIQVLFFLLKFMFWRKNNEAFLPFNVCFVARKVVA